MYPLDEKGNPDSNEFLTINMKFLVSEINWRKGNGAAAVIGDESCNDHWKAA